MLVTLENPGYSQIDIREHRIELTNEIYIKNIQSYSVVRSSTQL